MYSNPSSPVRDRKNGRRGEHRWTSNTGYRNPIVHDPNTDHNSISVCVYIYVRDKLMQTCRRRTRCIPIPRLVLNLKFPLFTDEKRHAVSNDNIEYIFINIYIYVYEFSKDKKMGGKKHIIFFSSSSRYNKISASRINNPLSVRRFYCTRNL